MNTKSIVLTLLASAFFFYASAQELAYGFKVGLNFAQIQGDLESAEDIGSSTGFHIGAGVVYKITDRFGVKADFLFSQKGGERSYNGDGVQLFFNEDGDKIPFAGNRNSSLNVTNSYIDFPITGYARFNKIEFSGGFYVGFLVSSKAVGDVTFAGDALDQVQAPFDLEYNYFKDEVPDPTTWVAGPEYRAMRVNNNDVLYPTAVGAYDDYDEKDGNFYKGIDMGLNAGIAYFLNQGLFVGVNLNYGLLDISNNDYDISYEELEGLEYKQRSDKDNNFMIMTSVGFSF